VLLLLPLLFRRPPGRRLRILIDINRAYNPIDNNIIRPIVAPTFSPCVNKPVSSSVYLSLVVELELVVVEDVVEDEEETKAIQTRSALLLSDIDEISLLSASLMCYA